MNGGGVLGAETSVQVRKVKKSAVFAAFTGVLGRIADRSCSRTARAIHAPFRFPRAPAALPGPPLLLRAYQAGPRLRSGSISAQPIRNRAQRSPRPDAQPRSRRRSG